MEKPKRGFASLSLERRKQIARMGGKACPPHKRAFFINKELAKMAGKNSRRGKTKTEQLNLLGDTNV